jgi:quercetin dioxygenase-like cupin family protein
MVKEKGWIIGAGKGIEESERGHIYKKKEDLNWVSHPLSEKVKLGFMVTKRDDKVDVTCLLAKIPKGSEVPIHSHEGNDILFILSGKGKVWIDGLGELELKRGILVNIPPKVSHKVFEVTEELEVYDVFSPAII